MRRGIGGLLAGLFMLTGGGMQVARAFEGFPEMEIDRATIDAEWPFAVDRGTLTCVALTRPDVVIFAEPWPDDVPQEFGNMTIPRSVIVSTNPLAILASFEDRELYLPFDTLETLVTRLAPYERIGLRLCREARADQPDQH